MTAAAGVFSGQEGRTGVLECWKNFIGKDVACEISWGAHASTLQFDENACTTHVGKNTRTTYREKLVHSFCVRASLTRDEVEGEPD